MAETAQWLGGNYATIVDALYSANEYKKFIAIDEALPRVADFLEADTNSGQSYSALRQLLALFSLHRVRVSENRHPQLATCIHETLRMLLKVALRAAPADLPGFSEQTLLHAVHQYDSPALSTLITAAASSSPSPANAGLWTAVAHAVAGRCQPKGPIAVQCKESALHYTRLVILYRKLVGLGGPAEAAGKLRADLQAIKRLCLTPPSPFLNMLDSPATPALLEFGRKLGPPISAIRVGTYLSDNGTLSELQGIASSLEFGSEDNLCFVDTTGANITDAPRAEDEEASAGESDGEEEDLFKVGSRAEATDAAAEVDVAPVAEPKGDEPQGAKASAEKGTKKVAKKAAAEERGPVAKKAAKRARKS
eukprot:TRINITY_DN2317_c0_g1_i1.p1 TRINITY_DN2317_c0_g1~~TRINITY_DN2317_c0_g1_i1.p1  ORF type:complete len:365 (-),score=76.39 TRINITY_DN2317_c0_g1_i1:805-1899(-)